MSDELPDLTPDQLRVTYTEEEVAEFLGQFDQARVDDVVDRLRFATEQQKDNAKVVKSVVDALSGLGNVAIKFLT